jgi:hypothetical protein
MGESETWVLCLLTPSNYGTHRIQNLSSCIGHYFEHTRLLEEMCYVNEINEFLFLESIEPFQWSTSQAVYKLYKYLLVCATRDMIFIYTYRHYLRFCCKLYFGD